MLVAATLLSRIAFRSSFLYDVDSVNFALALRRFDPAVHQPHPPGYFLYVRSGRLLQTVFDDPNTALTVMSILASCGAVAMIYLLAAAWFGGTPEGRTAALCAGGLFISSPLAWFHGTVALTYGIEAGFSSLLGYLCWRVYSGSTRSLLPSAAALGLAAGFRPSALLILLPVFAFSLRGVSRRQAMQGIGALGIVLIAWFLPMIAASGGVRPYAASLWALWTLVPSRQTVLSSPAYSSLARLCLIFGIYTLSFGCAALLPLRRLQSVIPQRARLQAFTFAWVLPGLVLFTFAFLKFVNSGYLLVLVPPACLWLGWWMADWYRHSSLPQTARTTMVVAAALIHAAIFLLAPFYFSYREVCRSRQELTTALASVRQTVQPSEAVIVGFDSHFLGYRHAGYYLPEYLTIQFPEVPLASSTGVFVMRNQDTRVVPRIRVDEFQQFILFPLPSSDPEYREYLQRVRARFPAGTLHATSLNGIELLTGPISALRWLFPNAVTWERRGP